MASTSLKKTASHSASSKATGSKTAAVAGGNSNQKVTHAFMQKDPKLANNWKKKAPHELSDAEVLSMPEAEYMNDAQMAFFKHKLQLLRDEILENAGETAEHLREDAVVVPDPVDRATIEEEHALELRTRDRERKLIKKIDETLQLIEDNDYGWCESCGVEIGVRRLEARPTATQCYDCKTVAEMKEKQLGAQ